MVESPSGIGAGASAIGAGASVIDSSSGIGAEASAIGAGASVLETDLVNSATPENVFYILKLFSRNTLYKKLYLR